MARYSAELKRRLENTKEGKKAKREKDKEMRMTATKERALKNPDDAEKILTKGEYEGWWQHTGQFEVLRTLNPKTVTVAVGAIWQPESERDAIPAQVETEEM